MVRARCTPDPFITCFTTNFCKKGGRVRFVLKPSWLLSSGFGGLTGTDPGPATPKKSYRRSDGVRSIPSPFCHPHNPLCHQTDKQPSTNLCFAISYQYLATTISDGCHMVYPGRSQCFPSCGTGLSPYLPTGPLPRYKTGARLVFFRIPTSISSYLSIC